MENEPEVLNYIHIFEIYLNDLNNNINDKISVFQDEIINEIGKERIRLFTIPLWSNYYMSEINYVIPSELSFKGDYILKAIKKLADIQDIVRLRILTEV